jgi:hypothetical protein
MGTGRDFDGGRFIDDGQLSGFEFCWITQLRELHIRLNLPKKE